MKKIERLRTICEVLNNFSAEHPGLLDDKVAGELKEMQEVLAVVQKERVAIKVALSSLRTERAVAHENLRLAALECWNALKMVAVRKIPNLSVPRMQDSLRNRTRIKDLAIDLSEAAESAGKKPAVQETAAELQGALDAFVKLDEQYRGRVVAFKTGSGGSAKDVRELSIKVNGNLEYVLSHVPDAQRKNIQNRLRTLLPHAPKKNGNGSETGADASGTQAQPAQTAPPAQQSGHIAA